MSGAMIDNGRLMAKLAKQSDEVLLGLTSRYGDREAFGVFFERHRDSLLAFLWSHTGNHEIAQDLASEAFATALLKVSTYDRRRGDGRVWLFGIARITMLASYRKRAVEESAREQLDLLIPEYSETAWEEVEQRLEKALPALVEGLDELPPSERDAVIARIVDERDYAEMALAANATEAAIRQRVSRGLRKLSRGLQNSSR
jgi:RNA polymerase sigma factor (sigma-70 family)